MSKLKTFAVTAIAVATGAVGGLAAAPTASAAPKSCSQARAVAVSYIAAGNVFRNTAHFITGTRA